MINQNKRGQQGIVSGIFIGVIILFVLAIGITAAVNSSGLSGFWSELGPATDSVSTGFMGVVGPLFNVLLGLDSAGDNSFLMVLVFILISIIVVGTLDSVNIFGEDGKGKTTNFLVGMIVSIIGVRFMPQDLWASLTAPSSAFVATILMALPFLAFFVITMKMKPGYTIARKLLWLFFLIVTVVLITKTIGDYKSIYTIFALLALLMLAFDSKVRAIFYKEKRKNDIVKEKDDLNLLARQAIREEIANVQKIITSANSPADEVAKAKRRLAQLNKKYADASSEE